MESVNCKEEKKAVVYTYRYIWKNVEGNLIVKYITDTLSAHEKFAELVNNDTNIVSCMCEYIGEIDYTMIGFTKAIKVENKEEEKKEGE